MASVSGPPWVPTRTSCSDELWVVCWNKPFFPIFFFCVLSQQQQSALGLLGCPREHGHRTQLQGMRGPNLSLNVRSASGLHCHQWDLIGLQQPRYIIFNCEEGADKIVMEDSIFSKVQSNVLLKALLCCLSRRLNEKRERAKPSVLVNSSRWQNGFGCCSW